MSKANEVEGHFYYCLRVAIAVFARDAGPILLIEFARRTIPTEVRPTFQERKAGCKRKAGDAPAEAAAQPEEKGA